MHMYTLTTFSHPWYHNTHLGALHFLYYSVSLKHKEFCILLFGCVLGSFQPVLATSMSAFSARLACAFSPLLWGQSSAGLSITPGARGVWAWMKLLSICFSGKTAYDRLLCYTGQLMVTCHLLVLAIHFQNSAFCLPHGPLKLSPGTLNGLCQCSLTQL